MKNRSLYSVLTRFGIVAAVLDDPAGNRLQRQTAQQAINPMPRWTYAENDDVPVATYSGGGP